MITIVSISISLQLKTKEFLYPFHQRSHWHRENLSAVSRSFTCKKASQYEFAGFGPDFRAQNSGQDESSGFFLKVTLQSE